MLERMNSFIHTFRFLYFTLLLDKVLEILA